MYTREEKPDYNRQTVKEEIKPLLKIQEYNSISLQKLNDYISSLTKNFKDKDIQLEFITYEESEGYEYPDTYIEIQPYFNRKENDKEYNKRIKEEEEEHNNYLEQKRLFEEKNKEYLKDLEEYNRIKEKYKFL